LWTNSAPPASREKRGLNRLKKEGRLRHEKGRKDATAGEKSCFQPVFWRERKEIVGEKNFPETVREGGKKKLACCAIAFEKEGLPKEEKRGSSWVIKGKKKKNGGLSKYIYQRRKTCAWRNHSNYEGKTKSPQHR